MSPTSRADRFAAWLLGPRGLMAFAVTLLFVVMAASFFNIPWTRNLPPSECGDALCEISVTPPGPSITGSLFDDYAILIIIIGLILATCMIGGVYLAKSEGGPP